jgi:hypothetical protein
MRFFYFLHLLKNFPAIFFLENFVNFIKKIPLYLSKNLSKIHHRIYFRNFFSYFCLKNNHLLHLSSHFLPKIYIYHHLRLFELILHYFFHYDLTKPYLLVSHILIYTCHQVVFSQNIPLLTDINMW